MKKYKKLAVSFVMIIFLCTALCSNASAATISDGLKAEISTSSAVQDTVPVDVVITNTNDYQMEQIRYTLTSTENGSLKGDLSGDSITLQAGESFAAQADLTVNADAVSPTGTAQSTEPSDTDATEAPTPPQQQSATEPTAVSLANASSAAGKTATGDSFNIWPVLAVLFFCAIVIGAAVAVKKKRGKNFLSLLLCFTLILPVGAASIMQANAAEDEFLSFTEQAEITLNGQTVTLTLTVTYPKQAEIHDNTLEDIAALNGGQPDVVYNDAGEISFLNGRFTDYKITNPDSALTALQSVETLFHTKENDVSAACILIKEDDNGDTYYTFQQAAGSAFLSTSYLTVGADKDGNALCISSSIIPQAGVADFENSMISAQQADAIVSSLFPTLPKVDKEPTLDYLHFNSALCWVVYRLDDSDIETMEEKPVYLKIYINATTGQALSMQTVTSLEDYRLESSEYNNDDYFQCSTELMTFTTYQGQQVQLPVATDEETGQYYFCDTQRRILPADGHQSAENNYTVPTLYYFDDPTEVPAIYVSVIYNITRAYDYYASNGVKSIDGEGIPLVLYLGYQENGKEIENACYMGNAFGWGVFMFSNFPISTSLDVAAHEFTHGVKYNWTGSAPYQNTTGAIEESYADILGNLTEMLIDPANSDTETWMLAESSGSPIRSMSNPNQYAQPEYFGDAYYQADVELPGSLNDNGGVHVNNSILSKIVFDSYEQGNMTMEEAYDLWLSTFLVFNPLADFDDVFAYIKYTAQRQGMDAYIPLLTELFEDAYILNADTSVFPDFPPKEGFTSVSFVVENLPENTEWVIVVKNSETGALSSICADKTGNTQMILPKGKLMFRFQELRDGVPKVYSILSEEEDPDVFTALEDSMTITFDYNTLTPVQPAAA